MTQRRSLILGAAALPLAAPAIAQGRPLRIIVPFPPGGAVDILGRVLAERLPAALGTPVVVENRGGAGGLIGADALAKGDRDGTMIGLISVTTLCAFPFMTSRLPFNPRTDLAPVTQITDGALLCVVNAEKARREGWSDFRRLVTWSRANPEQVKMGSSGTGTTSHINIEAINAEAGAKILHVPYRGGGPAITDLLAGTIDMMFDVMPALMPHVTAGRFLPLAVSSAARLSILPDVPGMADFADLGLGRHDVVTWNAVMAPGGTPPEHIQRLHAAIRAVGAQSEFVERLKPLGYGTVVSPTPAALTALIERDTPNWQRLVQLSGARLE
ncbi:Bug family tripartite tricarboxylate transporter substrate binding protein [Sediminicoccus rosea]|uniref:Tripartite tricarboxylate transporter substrate binding protein n=1 Tax=Sediminicoccus rosea TaxID=1225128 RepID=A0ABZ0PED5_9PROT|nr:tripartite tricarboxylate transporter substrate binding protein [Sediminicoccus rosea]WPB84009.1 tripartite tricarboxylate transporter substrate binding protein [Sediminicoccus rosea]